MPALDRLTTALAVRYRIAREPGEGRMATVYIARDGEHHRTVALKVLKPELDAVSGVERFLAQSQMTASRESRP